MRRLAIRLGIVVAVLAVASQLLLPSYYEHQIAGRLTDHGGSAHVALHVFPALRLLVGRAGRLDVVASGLSVDLDQNQQDVFKRLDDFSKVAVDVRSSRAGPFTISRFSVRSAPGDRTYSVAVAGDGTALDVARYAGSRLAGGFGQDLAGLAASVIGGFDRPIPFNARMEIDTGSGSPRARDVTGEVGGLPAGPLAQIVANALLGGL